MTAEITRQAAAYALREAIFTLESGRIDDGIRSLYRLLDALNTPDQFMVAASEILAERVIIE